MIFDTLNNLPKYINIPKIEMILDYLKQTDVFSLDTGDKDIDGKDLYVKVLRYFPKPAEENKFESHEKYADIQVIFKGIEKMQTTNKNNLQKIEGYKERSDLEFFNAENDISDILVGEGECVVFFPGDVHKPGCFYKELKEPVLKLVFKIRMG
jgi:YhcH/YjgK/YiaL family protein